MFKDSKILVTGGTGSWGQVLVEKLLLYNPNEIRIFSRNEFAQVEMKREFADNPILNFIIGDVRDFEAVNNATRGVDYVFHLAALKHVPICESQPLEALKTNVHGTENIIKASILHGVKKVIDVSTDKAVEPANFYGLTKAVGEKLMIQACDKSIQTRFVCIRGGNVIGTNGSVIPFFKNKILASDKLPLTSKEMSRFFLTIKDAIELLIKASEISIGGEIFVMKMKACRLIDLIEVLKDSFNRKDIKISEIGIRPGEKLHEVLISNYESQNTFRFDDEYYVIVPSEGNDELIRTYGHLSKVPFSRYQSNDELMSHKEISKILKSANVF